MIDFEDTLLTFQVYDANQFLFPNARIEADDEWSIDNFFHQNQ